MHDVEDNWPCNNIGYGDKDNEIFDYDVYNLSDFSSKDFSDPNLLYTVVHSDCCEAKDSHAGDNNGQ